MIPEKCIKCKHRIGLSPSKCSKFCKICEKEEAMNKNKGEKNE